VIRLHLLVRNAVSNAGYFGVNLFVTILLLPFMLHTLGSTVFGIWTIGNSILGYYGLVDLGVGSALLRFVARYREKNKDSSEYINQVLNTTLFFFSLAATAVLSLNLVLASSESFREFLNITEQYSDSFASFLLIMGLVFSVKIVDSVLSGAIQGFERYDLANLVNITSTVLRGILIYFALLHSPTLLAMTWAYLCSFAFSLVSNFLVLRRIFPELSIGLRFVSVERFREIIGYSGYSFGARVCDQLRFNTGIILVGVIFGPSTVTIYAIAYRLVDIFRGGILSISGVMTPTISRLEGSQHWADIQRIFVQGTRYVALITAFAGGSLILFGSSFIEIWLGKGFQQSYVLLVVLLIPSMVDVGQAVSTNVFYGLSRHRFLAILVATESFANVLLSLLLAPVYGPLGIAIGTAVPMLFSRILFQPAYACRLLEIPIKRYLLQGIVPSLISGTIYFGFGLLICYLFPPDRYATLISVAGIAFAFSGVLTYFAFGPSRLRARLSQVWWRMSPKQEL
jgi:O-antigen/teichoic acid export membrane protein